MKTNFTHAFIIRIILFILICLYSFLVFGQPGYNCQGVQVNAKHHFNNVRPDTHANMIVKDISYGLNLSAIDNTRPGFQETFQHTLNVTTYAKGHFDCLESNTKQQVSFETLDYLDRVVHHK